MNTTWSKTTRTIVLIAMLLFAIWAMVAIDPMVQVVGIAALLAYVLDPAVVALVRRGRLPRPAAAVVVFATFLLVLVGIPVWVGSVAAARVVSLGNELIAAVTELGDRMLQPVFILGYTFSPADWFADLNALLGNAITLVPGGSLNVLTAVTTNLLWGITVLFTLFYLLKDGHRIKPWLVSLLPAAYQPEYQKLLDEIDHIWGKAMRIQLVLFLILSLLMGAGTLLVVWLFRSGLLEWSVIGFILLLLVVYTAVQQIDNLWLRPQFLGRELRLHPGIAFIAIIGGVALGGLIGLLVAVPLVATLKTVGKYVHSKLLGLQPYPDLLASVEEVEDSGSPAPVAPLFSEAPTPANETD